MILKKRLFEYWYSFIFIFVALGRPIDIFSAFFLSLATQFNSLEYRMQLNRSNTLCSIEEVSRKMFVSLLLNSSGGQELKLCRTSESLIWLTSS